MVSTLNKSFSALSTPELYQIYRARTDVFVVEQNCAYPEVDDIDLTAQHLFEQAADGHLETYCRIYAGAQGAVWHIGRVLVAQQDRGRGLARQVLTTALTWLSEQTTATTVEVEAQVYLTAFYASLGFKAEGDAFDDFGIMHQKMTLQLVANGQ
ncbi:GNAT family N-acetyltransferase [Furfurilactobacillus sp. WILCCON 0119]|uniref:GNAT family N-acetyltransferase n=1 Tax=Furfurilactobacillus entadae TaxID=2922307 RepID=UPI0035E7EF88